MSKQRMTWRRAAGLASLAWGGLAVLPVSAADPLATPDLPRVAAVRRALDEHPDVRAAAAGVRAEQANQSRLVAGNHEFSVRVTGQRRTVDDPNQRFHEWDAGIERPLRLSGKAGLDTQLGQAGVEHAGWSLGDARHEASRALLRNWFVWLKESAQSRQWRDQVAALTEQSAAVAKRVRAGDASKLEASLADAALAQAQAAQAQAQGRAQIAASELTVRFPGIVLPPEPVLVEPRPLEQGIEHWREHLLEHNHELGTARAETRRSQLAAARSSAERVPDPTVGVRYASERSGSERIVGLTFAIPLPGQARAAAAGAAQAHAEAAASREAGALRKVEAETTGAFLTAQAAYANWQGLQSAAQRISSNTDLMARAYALGESGLGDVLMARRQAIEARLAAVIAQLDASEARYRVLLDAHELWPLDEDHEANAAK